MTEKRNTEQRSKERPIDRVRKLAEEAGVPWRETTRPGRRTLIFFGSAKSSGRGRGGA